MSPQPGLAIFKGTPGIVTIDGTAHNVSATGLQFSVDGYTLSGDALWLAADANNMASIDVGDGTAASAGYKAIISNVLVGGAGLDKVDFGTLVLTDANTYTGETDINAGKLALVGNGNIADSTSVVIDSAGTLDISGTTDGASINGLGGSGSIVLGGENLVVNGGSGFDGVISGTGGVTVTSGGFLTLNGANTYTGLTTIDQGAQLQLGTTHPGSVAGDILDNGTLWFFFDNADLTYGGVISGTGGIDKSGAGPGTLTLTGTNTFTGGVMVAGIAGDSVLAVSSDANLGAPTGAVELTGGTLEATASFTLNHQLDLYSTPARGQSVVQVDSGATLTVANSISGFSSDDLIKTGPGTLALAAMNGYGGSTMINEGTLALTGLGSLAASSGVNVAGTFDVSGTVGGSDIQSLSGSGAVNLGSNTLMLTNASGEFSGVIGGSGALSISGGTETLTGANTYTGGTTINAGTLQLGDGGTSGSIEGNVTDNGSLVFDRSDAPTYGGLISGTGSLRQAGTGTLTLTGTNSYGGGTTIDVAGALQLGNGGTSGSIAGDVTNNGYLFFDRSDAAVFSGVVSGTGTLRQFGTGTLTLTATNTYTGETDVSNGTLALSGNGSIASSFTVAVFNGGTLDISGTTAGATIKDLSSIGGTVMLGAKTLTLSDAINGFEGVITGTGGVVVSGGNLILSSVNTYTGTTTVDAGATLTLQGGEYSPFVGSIVGDVVNKGTLEFYNDSDVTYGGVISGPGPVLVDGVSMVTLTGANTFSGGAAVGGSVLSVAEDANLGATSGSVALNNGLLETTASFTLNHPLLLSGGGIQTDAGTTLTVASSISGTGGLSKKGPGTLVLAGTNTWTGGTTVVEGTLSASGSLGSGEVDLYPGTTLTGVKAVDGDVFSSGTIAVGGGDTAVSGDYTNSDGTLAVSLGSKLAVTGSATIYGGTLEVTGADSGYVANTHTDVLTATGGVTGTFDQLVKDSGVVFTSTTIGYGTNDVYLDTTGLNITVAAAEMGIAEPAAVSAAQRVQTGFETINATMASGGTPSPSVLQGAGAIQHSATPAVAQATLESLSGQLHAASAAMLFDGIDASGNALSEHFDDLLSGRTHTGVWYGDLGWQGNLQRSGYAGATFRSSGGMAGADLRIGAHALLGFAAGQSLGFGQLDAAWDHDRTWMNNVAVYGGLTNGAWYANAQVASGWYREDMQRLLQLGAMGSLVGTGSTGRYVAGSLEGGHLSRIGDTRIVPFADVRYQRLGLGGFSEQGGLGYGLEADARTAGRLQAGLGLRAEHGWRLANGMQMEFDGSAGWQHTLHQYGEVFDASFTGFNDWLPVEGVGLSRNTATLRVGLSLWPTRNFGMRIGYMLEHGEREHAGSAMLQGTLAF